jgi:hypothetical protein
MTIAIPLRRLFYDVQDEQIHQRDMQELAPLAKEGGITLPVIPAQVKPNYQIF